MNVDRIREAQGEIDEAQDEVLQWEARLAELDELLAEAAGTVSSAGQAGQGELLREKRFAESAARTARSRLGDAKRALLTVRMMRPRRSDGRHAA
jgi:hypothetical protein